METFESFVRFLSSYPLWAKLLAVGGILTTAVTLALAPRESHQNTTNSTDTVFLKISRVKLFGIDPHAAVQVIAYVNDGPHRYPSGVDGVEWVKVGEGMSGQTFLIPRAEQYEIRFELNLRNPTQRLVSNETVRTSTLPLSRTYSLHAVADNIKTDAIDANISFSLSTKP